MQTKPTQKSFRNEAWKAIEVPAGLYTKTPVSISNYGRLKFHTPEGDVIKNADIVNGYLRLKMYNTTSNKQTGRYIHKLVAQHFLEQPTNAVYVIHLDYDKTNNHISNLKWATKREKELHQYANLEYLKTKPKVPYSKLNEGQVKIIKRKIAENKTRLKMIAKNFGVSDMQISRIKSGQNWGHVTI